MQQIHLRIYSDFLFQDVYQIKQRRGLAIVINNYYFSASAFNERQGSDYDMENTKHLFELLNFEVIGKDNQTAKVCITVVC